MKRMTLYRVAALAVFAIAAPVLASDHGAPALPDSAKFEFTAEFIKTYLLFSLWLTVGAIIMGPLVYWFVGDLWLRKTDQPFTDDLGGHAGHSHAATTHH